MPCRKRNPANLLGWAAVLGLVMVGVGVRGSVVIFANQSWFCTWRANERVAFPKLGLGSSWVWFSYGIAINYFCVIKMFSYQNDGLFRCVLEP